MRTPWPFSFGSLLTVLFTPMPAFSTESGTETVLNLTTTGLGLTALLLFVVAYALVIGEEHLHMRKSKPVIVAAGVIWVLVAIAYNGVGKQAEMHAILEHNLLEYGQLFLFLLAAMTYINTLDERNL
ncbi:MAG: sodium:proton antiporter, partial [Thiothrix sp.]